MEFYSKSDELIAYLTWPTAAGVIERETPCLPLPLPLPQPTRVAIAPVHGAPNAKISRACFSFRPFYILRDKQKGETMSPVNLSEIIDALDCQSQEIHAYLNTKTGEIVMLTGQELGLDRDLDDASDESAEHDTGSDQEVVDSEDHIQLPGQFEINEYGMMERFSLALSNASQREALYYSIKGSGAFRRFKDNIRRMEIENDWYKYRDQQLKEIAIDWCKENNIPYTE